MGQKDDSHLDFQLDNPADHTQRDLDFILGDLQGLSPTSQVLSPLPFLTTLDTCSLLGWEVLGLLMLEHHPSRCSSFPGPGCATTQHSSLKESRSVVLVPIPCFTNTGNHEKCALYLLKKDHGRPAQSSHRVR